MANELSRLLYAKFDRDSTVTEVGKRSNTQADFVTQKRVFKNFTLVNTTQTELALIHDLADLDELWLCNLHPVRDVQVSVKVGGSYYYFATLKGGGDPIRISAKSGALYWLITNLGTMASATSTATAFIVGQTVIPLATAGTGVVAQGDGVTFANDTNHYRVQSVSFAGANPASGDSITLDYPGLLVAQSAATRAITVLSDACKCWVFAVEP